MTRCPICHGDLTPNQKVCKGRLPGPLGLIALSPGLCKSTPEQRIVAEAERRARVAAQPS